MIVTWQLHMQCFCRRWLQQSRFCMVFTASKHVHRRCTYSPLRHQIFGRYPSTHKHWCSLEYYPQTESVLPGEWKPLYVHSTCQTSISTRQVYLRVNVIRSVAFMSSCLDSLDVSSSTWEVWIIWFNMQCQYMKDFSTMYSPRCMQ